MMTRVEVPVQLEMEKRSQASARAGADLGAAEPRPEEAV